MLGYCCVYSENCINQPSEALQVAAQLKAHRMEVAEAQRPKLRGCQYLNLPLQKEVPTPARYMQVLVFESLLLTSVQADTFRVLIKNKERSFS